MGVIELVLILVVLIGLVIVFKKQINTLLTNIFKQINSKSKEVYDPAERHIETEKEVCGGITVFLSLILTCICALMGGLFESARAAGSGWYMQMALNSSLDSLMSCYHREDLG